METQTTTDATTASEANGAAAEAAKLGDRFRTRAKEVRAQLDAAEARAKERWSQVPDKLRGAFQQAVLKVRVGLDLPSRSELNSLSERLDQLDQKLSDYEVSSSSKKKRGQGASSEASA